jgi:hypothetical protein
LDISSNVDSKFDLIPILPKCRITIWETRIGPTTKCKTNQPTNICFYFAKDSNYYFWNGEEKG